jgi:hypothetical protein
MKRVVIVAAILGFGWYAWSQKRGSADQFQAQQFAAESTSGAELQATSTTFTCDGRQYCSQMTSCAEAKYFLKNCPGVKMDGSRGGEGPGDGIPCQRQWCTSD